MSADQPVVSVVDHQINRLSLLKFSVLQSTTYNNTIVKFASWKLKRKSLQSLHVVLFVYKIYFINLIVTKLQQKGSKPKANKQNSYRQNGSEIVLCNDCIYSGSNDKLQYWRNPAVRCENREKYNNVCHPIGWHRHRRWIHREKFNKWHTERLVSIHIDVM